MEYCEVSSLCDTELVIYYRHPWKLHCHLDCLYKNEANISFSPPDLEPGYCWYPCIDHFTNLDLLLCWLMGFWSHLLQNAGFHYLLQHVCQYISDYSTELGAATGCVLPFRNSDIQKKRKNLFDHVPHLVPVYCFWHFCHSISRDRRNERSTSMHMSQLLFS